MRPCELKKQTIDTIPLMSSAEVQKFVVLVLYVKFPEVARFKLPHN